MGITIKGKYKYDKCDNELMFATYILDDIKICALNVNYMIINVPY